MTLEEQIADLGLADSLATVLVHVASPVDVETGREAGYVSVRPAGCHIAAYFNRAFVDIAVQPLDSAGLCHRTPGSSVLRKTTATHYLRIPAEHVESEHAVALIEGALAWRQQGPRWSGSWSGGGSADLAGEQCAECNIVIAANGSCFCD